MDVVGVSGYADSSFFGMPWMPSLKSGTLMGVGEHARHIASVIAEADAPRQAPVAA